MPQNASMSTRPVRPGAEGVIACSSGDPWLSWASLDERVRRRGSSAASLREEVMPEVLAPRPVFSLG